ncbi:sigma-54-dependent Fis family transcriptional regulator [Lentimicrobium sp. L6]|uniref:sigma-54-dependent Fis family transcriptional regulator n=1 Tax=Lentimicrobium sp. L6 TaxID=2735916 RepID=UPI0015550E8A|nr:sigma-54-dependent Fis family transcriptional regulator [Lentimicrobium sp. L6]NPD84695.1 sigma-54-dependent Fis family transcriptional regulator [Lentimicrobium sp. L6]
MSVVERENIIDRSRHRSEEIGLKKDFQTACIKLQSHNKEALLDKNKALLAIAQPFIEGLKDILLESRFILILSDVNGSVLDIKGAEKTIEKAKQSNIIIGASMEEKNIGTNAIGTAIFEDRPIQVTAQQHYSEAFHNWTCSAAPIHNASGKVIGALNLTGDHKQEHEHTLGLVISAAKAIENKIASEEIQKNLFHAQNYAFAMMNQLSFGVFALNLHDQIVWANDTGCRAINTRRSILVDSPIGDILKSWPKIKRIILSNLGFLDEEHSFNIPNLKDHFLFNAYLIRTDGNEIIGYLITFRPFKRLMSLVNKYAGTITSYKFEDISSSSPLMMDVIDYAKKVAHSPTSVLISGESGTGKEVFAQAIHNASDRKNQAFIAINCGAISASLIESELFGYENGAFTGALKGGRPGKFELANGGTLFLDEIGEMPPDMQVKLLRAIQEGQITRLGGDKIIPVDVRIIAATNKNLEEEVKNNKFRLDLYYRINVISIEIPPLRNRREDIPNLAMHFLQNKAIKLNKPMMRLSNTLLKQISSYSWPGNVRELENYIEKVTILSSPISIQQHQFTKEESRVLIEPKEELEFSPSSLKDMEKQAILKTIAFHHSNMTQVAKSLGISRNALYQKMKRYDISLKA